MAADNVDEEDEGGDEPSSFLFSDPSACLEEVESLLGEYVSLECNFHMSPPPARAMSDGLAENSGMLAVSMRKSSSVAKDFN